jgi:hypothetical protein
MKRFLFLICCTFFCYSSAEAQCFNGCRVNTYYPNAVYFESSLNYEIRNISENERFYVKIKAWDRNYTIPVINGYMPEISYNGNYNNLVLDYSSRIEYTNEKFGRLDVINYVDNTASAVKTNKPSVPKGPDAPKVKNVTSAVKSNIPKRPSTEDIDLILDGKVKKEVKKVQRPNGENSNEFIDKLLEK